MYPAGRSAVASLRTVPTAAAHIILRGQSPKPIVSFQLSQPVHPACRIPLHTHSTRPLRAARPSLASNGSGAHRGVLLHPSLVTALTSTRTTSGHPISNSKNLPRAHRTPRLPSSPVSPHPPLLSRPLSAHRMDARPSAAAAAAAAEGAAGEKITDGAVSDAAMAMTSDGRIRVASFEHGGGTTVGVVRDARIWPLHECVQQPSSLPASIDLHCMASVIAAWQDIRPRLNFEKLPEGQGQLLCESHLLAPLPRPAGAIMCIGKNYEEHVREVDTWKTAPHITEPSIPTHPIVFTKAPQSVTGPGAAIRIPHGHSEAIDYEAELAVIIGKPGRGIKAEDAMKHVFGYTILNDVTARDVQKRHQQWFLGKSCDTFCPMGPWIVPASEINGQDLHIRCWINDELRQNARTSQLIFPIPTLIATISAGITLQPGDIIATGTPAGVGSGFDPPRHLKHGDSVRIQIENVGELTNRVE